MAFGDRRICARSSPTVRFPSLEHAGEPMLEWARLVHAALHAKGRAELGRRLRPIRTRQPNDSAENKAKNRRTEITLQSNIDELVALPTAR